MTDPQPSEEHPHEPHPSDTDEAAAARHLGHLGALLLDAGLSVTDVRAALEQAAETHPRTARALTFSVLPEAVLVTKPETGTVRMFHSDAAELSFRQSAHASRLVHETTSAAVPLDGLPERIDRIRAMPRPHPQLSWILGSALVAGGLATVFRCPWWAILIAMAAGGLVGILKTILDRIESGAAIVPFVAAFVSTLVVASVASAVGAGSVPLFGVCAPIAILVPGALITNALLELTATDIVTGSARLLYGLIMLGFMAGGIAAGAAVTGLRIDPDSAALVGQISSVAGSDGWQALPPLWLSWIGVVALAVGVGCAFGSGLKLTALSVGVMVCTYAVLTAASAWVGNVVATGVSAAVLFVAARMIERLTVAVPATISFQPAFLLLVPGTVGLVALASFDTHALQTTPATFASLCIGIKIGALVAEIGTPGDRGRRA
ncbi:threonine/serine exporter family protein [Gordonia sp. i37]|uniref:threonine/serine exporter family protein n=1 Tax=Gordonia sp. i37 TaxID=1961707 RepID=UPI0009AE624A|nr:threonine/serine exporter family protein [Gordonia sp. i37]OPX16093.1 hypothetical protein B1964_06590 [Gordonia sp. i37]